MPQLTQKRAHDQYLEDLAQYAYQTYNYLELGTGTTPLSNSGTTLASPVQIGTTLTEYNKLNESGTTNSYINGRTSITKWRIDVGEPNSQPVVLREAGVAKAATQGANGGIRALFNVEQTKDSSVVHIYRVTQRTNRQGE